MHTSEDQVPRSHFMALSIVMVIHNSRPLPDLEARYSNVITPSDFQQGPLQYQDVYARTVSMAMIKGKWKIGNELLFLSIDGHVN
jgi:hypothetical protein